MITRLPTPSGDCEYKSMEASTLPPGRNEIGKIITEQVA